MLRFFPLFLQDLQPMNQKKGCLFRHFFFPLDSNPCMYTIHSGTPSLHFFLGYMLLLATNILLTYKVGWSQIRRGVCLLTTRE